MSALAPRPLDVHRRVVLAMLSARPERWLPGAPARWAAEVSWDRFLAEADEVIRPYLHWVCEQPPFEAVVPQSVRDALAAEHRAVGIRTLRWTSELREILAAFARGAVPLLVVKGSVLQRTVYPLPSTRPMSDLDLVVRREDLEPACALLETLGYALRMQLEDETPPPGMQSGEECNFVKPVGDRVLFVELHTRLDFGDTRLAVSPSPLWSLETRVEGHDGLALATLEPEATLRHLCIHLAQHHGFVRGMLWLLDLRLYVERHGAAIRWDRFMRECTPKSRPYVALALALAADGLGAEVPPDVTAALPARDRDALMDLAWDQIWDCVRTRRPPGSLVLLGLGDWRRFGRFVGSRVQRWSTPSPGSATPAPLLAGRRAWKELRIYGAALREGGFTWSSLRTARRSERRAARLDALLSSAGVE
jgi:hypothetical protein